MARFSYTATTIEGVIVEGFIEAADEKAALDRIKDTGIIPLKVTAPREGLRKRFEFHSHRKGLLTFTTELSALLNAGLPLDRSLNILTEISEGKQMKAVVHTILQKIREGNTFSDALSQHPKVFPRLYVNMVRAGEAGGVLDVVLEKLGEFLENAKELKDNMISAITYPSFLVGVSLVAIIIIFTFVIPRFTQIFKEMGTTLPLSTQILQSVSGFLQSYWWVILAGIIAIIIAFRYYIKTENGRYRWDALKLKALGDIIAKLETARFCRTLGTLLKGGVPFLQALANSKEVVTNRVIARALDTVSKEVKEGRGVAAPLAATGAFPQLALSMIKVGEETGQLETMLLKVASTYEKSLQNAVKVFTGVFGPVVLIFMALIIALIVISIFMAILSITDLPF